MNFKTYIIRSKKEKKEKKVTQFIRDSISVLKLFNLVYTWDNIFFLNSTNHLSIHQVSICCARVEDVE